MSTGGDSPSLWGGDGIEAAEFEPVAMPRGISLTVQKAEKQPMDGIPSIAAVIRHEDRYKAWYSVWPCPDPEPFSTKNSIVTGHNHHVAYAESTDAVTWDKPNLSQFEYAGNRDNNIVFRGDLNGSIRGFHGGSVFLDPSSENERFKMIYLGVCTDDEWDSFDEKYPGEIDTMARRSRNSGKFRHVFAVYGAVSPDGIHWESLPQPLMIQHSDTLQTCYYDVDRKLYIAYVRTWQVDAQADSMAEKFPDSWVDVGRRCIGRSVSQNFRHFSKAEIVISTGADMAPSHVWYTNAKTTLPGCPDQHVMFPWRWERERDGGHVWLFSSPDGWIYSQVPGGPVIECGAPGDPDGIYLGASPNLIELPDGRWALPYGGQPIPHKYPGRDAAARKGLFPGVDGIHGYACWKKGRLVALECPGEGEFATVGVIPPGNRLKLNASVLPTGYIKVGVSYLGGDFLPGRKCEDMDRIVGDNVDFPVNWRGEADISHKKEPIVLHFQLKQAKLFGLEFL